MYKYTNDEYKTFTTEYEGIVRINNWLHNNKAVCPDDGTPSSGQ